MYYVVSTFMDCVASPSPLHHRRVTPGLGALGAASKSGVAKAQSVSTPLSKVTNANAKTVQPANLVLPPAADFFQPPVLTEKIVADEPTAESVALPVAPVLLPTLRINGTDATPANNAALTVAGDAVLPRICETASNITIVAFASSLAATTVSIDIPATTATALITLTPVIVNSVSGAEICNSLVTTNDACVTSVADSFTLKAPVIRNDTCTNDWTVVGKKGKGSPLKPS